MDIYYSEGGYNKHLIDKHRIRNTGHHPPIVINKIWSKIPERPPLLDGQKECRICSARFFDTFNFYNHERKCHKRTVEEEDKQCSLYRLIETQEKEEQEEKKNAEDKKRSFENEESEIIQPTPIKRKRRSRSKKRNWMTSKKRSRKPSASEDVPSRVYVKRQVDPNDLDKSRDKSKNVEFYQEVLECHKKTGKGDQVNYSTEQSPESNHAPDTDFRISSVGNTTTDSSIEKPLPFINRPKTRSQLQMEQKVAEENKAALEKEKNQSVDVNSESQKKEAIKILNRQEEKHNDTTSKKSVDDTLKSEISDNPIVSTGVDEEKSEISEKGKNLIQEMGKLVEILVPIKNQTERGPTLALTSYRSHR